MKCLLDIIKELLLLCVIMIEALLKIVIYKSLFKNITAGI